MRRRRPAPRPKDAGRTRNLFFFPEAARRRPRWRRHHPADDWTHGFASPRNTDTPPAETRPGFLSLTHGKRREFYAESDTPVAGRASLVLLALALLLIRLFC